MTANPLFFVVEPNDTRNYTADRDHAALVRDVLRHRTECHDALCRYEDAATKTRTPAIAAPRLVEDAKTETRPSAASPRGGARNGVPRSPVSATGPSARLMALPQPEAGQLNTPEGVDEYLTLLEAARQRQLDALPPVPRDVVAAAHRDTVTRILDEVRVALQRVSDGLYGICTGCGTGIDPERLELLPWSTTCACCYPHSPR